MEQAVLKNWILKYNILWEDWLRYKHNGLNVRDRYIITVQMRNNFLVKPGAGNLFYNKQIVLLNLADKLEQNYGVYQEWLLTKFFFVLLTQYSGVHFCEFSKPITRMNMEPQLIDILLEFNQPTLELLFKESYEYQFREEEWFKLVRKFMNNYTTTNAFIRKRSSDKKKRKPIIIKGNSIDF